MDSSLLKSRKFWAFLVGELGVVFKAPPFAQCTPETQATLMVAIGIAYIIGTAIESGLERFGIQKKV